MIKLKDLLKEGKLNEEKYIVASIYGDLYTPKAVPEKQAKKLMMKLANQYAGDNVFMLGVKAWNKPHKYNKKKIKVKEGKLTEGVDYRVTIEDRKGKLIQGGNFTLKSDANLYIKDMVKKHKLKRGKGLWYNEKTGVEMSTNF